jgi:hypothetical protein
MSHHVCNGDRESLFGALKETRAENARLRERVGALEVALKEALPMAEGYADHHQGPGYELSLLKIAGFRKLVTP